jgi:hypothetical protein
VVAVTVSVAAVSAVTEACSAALGGDDFFCITRPPINHSRASMAEGKSSGLDHVGCGSTVLFENQK